MSLIKEVGQKLAIELVGRAITPQSVAKWREWMGVQAETYASRTETTVDDTILKALDAVWGPEIERMVVQAVLGMALDFAKTTETPVDDKLLVLFAKAYGVTVKA